MLNKTKEQFQLEQDQLLTTILNLRYFEPWKRNSNNPIDLRQDSNVELFLTNVCNQHCEYCYLIRHPELYPKETTNPKNILEKLRIIYDYFIEQKYHIPKIEFFTGEIWQSQFGLDVLQLTLDYLKKGLNADWFLIASNVSFLLNEVQTCKIQNYIDEFRNLGKDLVFSISVDGKIIENNNRPLNNGIEKTDAFYERMFIFAKHNHYCFHPMVSSSSAKLWIENYKWWESQMLYYDLNPNGLMMLEVRNNDWTDESIQDYCNFLEFLMNRYCETQCHNDNLVFAKAFLNIMDPDTPPLGGYVPWALPESDSFIGCSANTDLCIRVGDLALCPCHRTAYNKYLYGYFITENNKIVGIEANNPQMAVHVIMTNFNNGIGGCDTCIYNEYCLKGCLGSQLETTGDPFIPEPGVCKFFKAKYNFIFTRIKERGFLDYYKTFKVTELDYMKIQKLLSIIKRWEKMNVEQCK